MSANRRRSVIDALDKTRQEHPHPTTPSTTTAANAPLFRVASRDVTDEILEQSEAVHLPKDETERKKEEEEEEEEERMEKLMGLTSTAATHPGTTTTSWQPFASKSSNQLPSPSVTTDHGYGAQDLHDKPSVLPEILPGFKDRMADIHHATLKSVSDVTPSHGSSSGEEGGKWTGGTMFPAMTPSTAAGGFKNPFNTGSVSHQQQQQQQQQQHGQNHTGSAEEEANRKIARSSILYESAELEESTTSLSDDNDPRNHNNNNNNNSNNNHPQRHSPSDQIGGASTTTTSSTLVQGGQGGRRWSHELSPEKAGLVGSVLSVAGLVKDVVLDKIQQRPPTSSTGRTYQQHHLTEADGKQVAAGVAFGGSEESGDQTILLDGLLHHHQNHEAERAAAAAAASTKTGGGAEELLKAAPAAGKEHQKSVFHLAANPETMKSLLLDHPESLGYHGSGGVVGVGAKDQQSMGDSASLAAALEVQHQRSASGQDLSKTSR